MSLFINYLFYIRYVLLDVKTNQIPFWSFSFDFGASNAFLSISDSRWNSVSKSFSLKSQFINDCFNNCRFLETSEVLVRFFSSKGLDYMVYFLLVIYVEQRYGAENFSDLLVCNKQLSVTYFVLCFYVLLCLKPQRVFAIKFNCKMVIIELLNEFLKLYYRPIWKKEYIINKSAVRVYKWMCVWINVFFQIFPENGW